MDPITIAIGVGLLLSGCSFSYSRKDQQTMNINGNGEVAVSGTCDSDSEVLSAVQRAKRMACNSDQTFVADAGSQSSFSCVDGRYDVLIRGKCR